MPTVSGKKTIGLADTNLLVYAHDLSSPLHRQAKVWLEKMINNHRIVLSWQNLLEFYAIINDRKRCLRPLSAEQAIDLILGYLKTVTIIHPSAKKKFDFGLKIFRRLKPKGVKIFDLNLAAEVLASNLSVIYTVNIADFKSIPGLQAINPLQ